MNEAWRMHNCDRVALWLVENKLGLSEDKLWLADAAELQLIEGLTD
ncbi:MAG: hypothetical protein MJZ82_03610 [Paludibacteraceae bacterium]|nr:hypothetical protein [Paludibacteraceae bacterium]